MWNGMNQGVSYKHGRHMQGNKALNEQRIHPTQKPVQLYLWIIEKYLKKTDLILDTHVGSASSLIAYEMNDIKYVGFEKDPTHYEDSVNRLLEYRYPERAGTSQGFLF